MCYWMTGLSGAGKTTLARAMCERVNADGAIRMVMLDGDAVRASLSRDLGFSESDRLENARRLAAMARLLVDEGLSVVVSSISPSQAARVLARSVFEPETFFLLHVATPLKLCMQRDVKGLYRRAAEGNLPHLTGISAPFEVPSSCDLQLSGSGQLNADLTVWLDHWACCKQ